MSYFLCFEMFYFLLSIVFENLSQPNLIKHSLLLIADIFQKGKNFQRSAIAAMLRRCPLREFPMLNEFLNIIMKDKNFFENSNY